MIVVEPLQAVVSALWRLSFAWWPEDSCGSLDEEPEVGATPALPGSPGPEEQKKGQQERELQQGLQQEEREGEGEEGEERPCRREVYSIDDPESWPDCPVLMRPEPATGMQLTEEGPQVIRACRLHRFQSPIFSGCIVIRAEGLPTSEEGQFGGRKRKLQVVVQGSFTAEVGYADLIAGEEFPRPFTDPPNSWLVSLFLLVARQISPCYTLAGPEEPRPGVTGLMLGLAQSVCVSEPGSEPDPLGIPYEDTSLLGDSFPSGFEQRKKFFSRPGPSWESWSFDTSRVWTFGFWEHLMSIADFKLDLGIVSLSTTNLIKDQPLIICARAGGSSMYSVEIWHEALARGFCAALKQAAEEAGHDIAQDPN
mmetsp:Transcript_14681/g.41300  ORF Transcript_14681/g.41300 Transcript_14681/m.41300 type:complete len:366 (-) Transcript_14681:144-1241(-)|eukprot:CAMPEP_0117667394 /NCGR_PEP_ID=MMETSP0804-20121206/10938_1 /TAXON_ID=1074897 /ORGANISM="Tetraselmis astigmatica, Strain CCMP880" /LENGTH=365 /DNA_ID=CAMNT_0005475107 /DNA_START=261 /DNA_END=1358 /DNA_ORIENTATION=+